MTLNLPNFGKNIDYWHELKSGLGQEVNIELINKAYLFAAKAHEGQKRESGEPYISHPVWVALVISQLGVGEEAIVAALLHDCVEDTEISIDKISRIFGDEVALLVEGMTEVKKKTNGIEVHHTNIEIFRRFLFSSVNDVRVLIIRLVDKLHNGLTIGALPKDRQIKYAQRVLGIYGPVAEYVGLHFFRRVLEDISFKILYPGEAMIIERKLKSRENEERKALILIKDNLNKLLEINNLKNFEIQSRIKSLYSTYLKSKRRPGDEAFLDRVGIRVITESVADCYSVLGLLHSTYQYIPEEFNDYISNPKPNGYRSLQTTLNWREKLTVEVQIRTKAMHEFNEFGPASHIAYKLSKSDDKSIGFEWVRDLIKWQKNDNKINNYTINVLAKYVYVFTPKGDTIQMKAGSTALDFAYRIHGEIGNHCVGAIINQRMGKIDDVLKTGDLVEILTSKKIQRERNGLK